MNMRRKQVESGCGCHGAADASVPFFPIRLGRTTLTGTPWTESAGTPTRRRKAEERSRGPGSVPGAVYKIDDPWARDITTVQFVAVTFEPDISEGILREFATAARSAALGLASLELPIASVDAVPPLDIIRLRQEEGVVAEGYPSGNAAQFDGPGLAAGQLDDVFQDALRIVDWWISPIWVAAEPGCGDTGLACYAPPARGAPPMLNVDTALIGATLPFPLKEGEWRRFGVVSTVAHELVHAVQFHSGFSNAVRSSGDEGYALLRFFEEGTAELLGRVVGARAARWQDYVRAPNDWCSNTATWSPRRRWTVPLWADRDRKRDPYDTAEFFANVNGGSLAYLPTFFNNGLARVNEEDPAGTTLADKMFDALRLALGVSVRDGFRSIFAEVMRRRGRYPRHWNAAEVSDGIADKHGAAVRVAGSSNDSVLIVVRSAESAVVFGPHRGIDGVVELAPLAAQSLRIYVPVDQQYRFRRISAPANLRFVVVERDGENLGWLGRDTADLSARPASFEREVVVDGTAFGFFDVDVMYIQTSISPNANLDAVSYSFSIEEA